MSKIGYLLLTALLASVLCGCTPTTEPEDVPEPPMAPRQEQPQGESAKEVVRGYSKGLTGSIDKSRDLQAKSELDTLNTAVQSYYYENGTYPESLDEVADYALGGTDVNNFDYDPKTGEVSLK